MITSFTSAKVEPWWNQDLPVDHGGEYREGEQGYKTAAEEQQIIALIASGVSSEEELLKQTGLSAKTLGYRLRDLVEAGIIHNVSLMKAYEDCGPYAQGRRWVVDLVLKHGSAKEAAKHSKYSHSFIAGGLGYALKLGKEAGVKVADPCWEIAKI